MNAFLWTLQILVAAAFLIAGGLKVARTREQLQPIMPWVDDMSQSAVRGIGVVEILGAIGLILPWALSIA
ncbi:MAG TPA: DoxX family protein, partial [Micromonosporaceae bacterium]